MCAFYASRSDKRAGRMSRVFLNFVLSYLLSCARVHVAFIPFISLPSILIEIALASPFLWEQLALFMSWNLQELLSSFRTLSSRLERRESMQKGRIISQESYVLMRHRFCPLVIPDSRDARENREDPWLFAITFLLLPTFTRSRCFHRWLTRPVQNSSS